MYCGNSNRVVLLGSFLRATVCGAGGYGAIDFFTPCIVRHFYFGGAHASEGSLVGARAREGCFSVAIPCGLELRALLEDFDANAKVDY